MSLSERALSALKELGLTGTEVKAYISLLQRGTMTANDVSREARIPYSKVYIALESLHEKGWVDDRRKRELSISSQCRLGQAARRLVIQGGWLAKWIGKTPREVAISQSTKAGIDFTGTIDHVAGMMQEIMEEVGGDGFLFFNGAFDRR